MCVCLFVFSIFPPCLCLQTDAVLLSLSLSLHTSQNDTAFKTPPFLPVFRLVSSVFGALYRRIALPQFDIYCIYVCRCTLFEQKDKRPNNRNDKSKKQQKADTKKLHFGASYCKMTLFPSRVCIENDTVFVIL
jgi:hypothetical protein